MATYADAVAERSRLMNSYLGVTARVVTISGGYGVQLHDVRGSERKTTGQRVVLGVLLPLETSARLGWSVVHGTMSTIQAQYT